MARMRRSTALLAAAVALAAVAGCSTSADQASSEAQAQAAAEAASANGSVKATISFMEDMAAGAGKSTLARLTVEFEQQNPGITVDLVEEPDAASLLAKETAAVRAGHAPTLGQVTEGSAAGFADRQQILPVSQYADSDLPLGLSSFYIGVQQDLRLADGQLWMWPLGESVQLLYYNQALLSAKGLNPPVSWAEFAAEAKTLSGGGTTAISVDPGSSASPQGGQVLFALLAAAFGKPDFAANGSPQLNSPAAVEALTYLSDLKRDGTLAVGSDDPGERALGSRKGVFDLGPATGYAGEARAAGGAAALGTELLPTGPDNEPGNVVSGTNLAMFAGSSAVQQAAGWKYMQFLASTPVQAEWSEATGFLPASPGALLQMGGYTAKNPWLTTAVAALQYASAAPAFPWVAKAQGAEAVAVAAVLEQGADPTVALDAAQAAALADQQAGQ